MNVEEYQIECVANILEENGIKVDLDKVAAIAKDLYHHIEMEREFAMTPHLYSGEKKCEKCERLKEQLKESDKHIDLYKGALIEVGRFGNSTPYIHNGTVKIHRR